MSLLDVALVTLPEAKRFLGIEADVDTNDDILEMFIDGITGDFEGEARRKLKLQTISSYALDGKGTDWIRLPYWPISTVSSIVIKNHDGTTLRTLTNDTSPAELSGAEFTVGALDGTLRLYSGAFPCGVNNVLVTWNAGFASDSPEMKRLRLLCLIQLQSEYRQWEKSDFGVASRQFQDGGITFERSTDGLLPRIVRALEWFQPKRAG